MAVFVTSLSSTSLTSATDASNAATAHTLDITQKFRRGAGVCIEPEQRQGKTILSGVTAITGYDLKPFQTSFRIPELADPYVTQIKDGAIISGTAQYYLKFRSMDDIQHGGPYQVVWNDYYYSDGAPMEGERYHAHSWDMKPVPWILPPPAPDGNQKARLWNPDTDTDTPTIIWYGGHMRPRPNESISHWPSDNYSRDIFAFIEKSPGRWFSLEQSIFARKNNQTSDWPREFGNFLGHRYGHQMVMIPTMKEGVATESPAVFYEEVTAIRPDGSPHITKILMDEMATPYQASGNPVEIINPINPLTGKPYPSTIREDGSILVEGPLYFRFVHEEHEWEAIGFSAGSFYGNYIASFASRKVSDGLLGKPYDLDLNDDGSDLHNAGAALGRILNLAGGPARPAVLVNPLGRAVPDRFGSLQVLVHGYRKDILPDNEYGRWPVKYRLDQMYRVILHTTLEVTNGPRGTLRFLIQAPQEQKANWNDAAPLSSTTPTPTPAQEPASSLRL